MNKALKKHTEEVVKLHKFHNKMLQIRKIIESCTTNEQVENTIEWIDLILISDPLKDYREASFKEWFFFLCTIKKETFVPENIEKIIK